jgi:deoxyribose-phosphate aldolase
MSSNGSAASRRLLDEIGSVDAVGIEERVAKYATRSIKKSSKVFGLKLAVSMVDLTTLEGQGHPGKGSLPLRQGPEPA